MAYMTHRNWGVLPPGREWGRVSGVSIDPNGTDVWVFERCGGDNCITSDDPTVLKLSANGTLLASFGADMFLRPHGMYVDAEGNVWVTDGRIARGPELEAHPDAATKGNQVVKFSPTGDVLLVLGTPGEEGDPPAALDQPNDVIVAPNGEVLVAEGHGSAGPGRISRFAADGTYLGSFGELGSGPGQFNVPHALAFDSRGRLFVADRGNSRIQIFDSSYRFVDEWRQFGRPNDVFIDEDDTMYVLDSESGDERNPGVRRGIYIGSARDGSVTNFIEPHASDRDGEGAYGTMGEGVAVDAAGNIYVGEVSLSGMTMFMPMAQMAH
jgi:DNA-binding beta-propeller fold protein YncE